MTQEVQVILTLEVDVKLTPQKIKNAMNQMITVYTLHCPTIDRMLIPKIEILNIKEESEIYKTE